MTTSLAQQLKQLAIPQTQALLGDDTRKASFLYDPKKAASIDRETFFCIGVNGLEELCALDEAFEQFEPHLFSESALSFERSIQTKEVNEQLDRFIDAFLLRLSPYLQLSCAHKALEWLIQRYRIHLNNVDSLFRCFLPYHELELFPKMLQLIDLKANKNQKWAWLLPLQKNGVHLTRLTLVNHCRTDPAFLAIITDMVPCYIKAFHTGEANRDERLRIVMNFYGLTLLAMVQVGPVTERILSAILPVVSRGLKSGVVDYKAASYVIISNVMSKTTLKPSLVETFMNGVCKNLTASLGKEGVSVLLLMFHTQEIDKLTKKAFKRLSQLQNLTPILASLSTKFEASRFVSAIFKRLIPAAVKQAALDVVSGSSSSSYSSEDESSSFRPHLMTVVYDIITQVSLETDTRTLAARLLLENFVQYCGDESIDQEKAVSQVKKVVRVFETRYPESLDSAVDAVMSSVENTPEKSVIERFLNLAVSSVHHRLAPDSHTTLALSLHHPHASVRLRAVTYLLDTVDSIDDKKSVKESFLARLQDDSAAVVKLLLKEPQKLLSVFTDKEELTSALLTKLKAVDVNVHKVGLVTQLLGVLTQTHMTPTLEAVALSYLFLPSQQVPALQLVVHLLSSQLATSSSILSHLSKVWLPLVRKVMSKSGKQLSGEDTSALNTALCDSLAEAVATTDEPHATMERLTKGVGTVSSVRQKCLAYLLCEVGLRAAQKTQDLQLSCRLRLQLMDMLKDFMFEKKLFSMQPPKPSPIAVDVSSEVITKLCKDRNLPAVWWRDLLDRWIASLEVPEQLKEKEFWHKVEAGTTTGLWLQAVIMLMDILLQVSSYVKKSETAVFQLTDLQNKVFSSAELYLRCLCVLWSGENAAHLGVTSALRDSALKLTQPYLVSMSNADATSTVQSSAPVLPCLLTLCASEVDAVRHAALGMMFTLNTRCSCSSALYKPVLELIAHYKEEISADASYLAIALTGLQTSKSSKRKGKLSETLSALLGVAESPSTPAFVTSGVLQALSGTDTMESLTPLLPLLARLLEQDTLNQHQLEAVRCLLARFTQSVAPELDSNRLPLQLLTDAMKNQTKTPEGTSVQQMAISQVNKKFFAALPSLESQRCIAQSLLDVLQSTTGSAIATLIRKIFKHISLPASLLSGELAPILQSAAMSVREVKRMKREDVGEKSTFDNPAWIRTTVLLEIMQTKKKIPEGCKLVPVCFQILVRVLEVENAGEGEYLKQLILGVIHNLCKKHSPDGEFIKGKDLNLEAIVQCIRTTNNPHTHQQALFVLSVAAQIAPEQLLHSMMSVFTFMGASILRQDDSYSFQVITRILETVFPALVMACSKHKEHKVVDMVTMVLRVFVDTYPHIPEHRKLMVFTTLLRVVGVESYLWRLLLVFIEGVAARSKTGTSVAVGNESASAVEEQDGKSKAIDQVHVDFMISLVLEFSPLNCLQMAHQALQYLAKLPDEKGDVKQKVRRQSVSVLEASREECEIFSLAYHSAKQLHKFKHATIVMLHQLLSHRNFITMISDKLDKETLGVLKEILETLLAYMAHTNTVVERLSSSPHLAYWKGLLVKCNNLLDSLVSLLPQDQFLMVVSELLGSSLLTVQRKAMELLNSRLRHLKDADLSQQQTAVLVELVPKLQVLVSHLMDSGTNESEEAANNGRMALYSLMLLVRVLGMEYHVTFVQVLKQVCTVMKDEAVSSEATATAMMCAAEIVSNIRAYSIVHLPIIMPSILQQLREAETLEVDMLACCVTSLHKILDTLPHFLTPYLQDILTEVCHLQTVLSDMPANEQKDHVLRSLKHASKSVAGLSPRVFLPMLDTCYTSLLEAGKQESITSLLLVLSQHVSNLSREDLHTSYQPLLNFFLVALDFRVTQRKVVSSDVIDKVEGTVIDTIVSMVLKMTEGTLRPMLLKMFEWATKGAHRNRVIAFYRLADCLAGRLRGLFLLFAAHIIKHAAQLLDLLNTSKTDEQYLKKDKKGRKSSKLLNSLLGCVQKVSLFDTQNFINKERFNMLMQPLLDQLENFVGGTELYQARVREYLVPAIADFAAAAKNDSLWKTLNYQLMLKTRNKDKEVRLSALHALKGLHKKLGEDYLNLLPETIPFISELMEDDCEEVEALTQEVIADMEETFGEPLQKYFN